MDATLAELFRAAVAHASSRIEWYGRNAQTKAATAKGLRKSALILFAVGTIAPISALPLSGMMTAVPKCPAGPPGSALWCDHPGQGHREHASAGRPTLEPWAVSPSLYLAAPAARPDAP